MKTLLVPFLSLGLLVGCSSSVSVNPIDWFSDDSPPKFTMDIRAESNINPNVDNLPSPVEIRVYQLADSEAFNQADFIQLYNDDQGALKAGLLSKRYLPSVMPGETRTEIIPANAEAKFVGVIVAFANYREANNKAIFTSFGYWSQTITLQLDGINLTMTGTED